MVACRSCRPIFSLLGERLARPLRCHQMIDSHYIYRPPALDAETFAAFVGDAEKVLRDAQSEVYLAGENGTGKPELDNYRVAFNGDGSMGWTVSR